MNANRQEWSGWFQKNKALNNFVSVKSYASVLKNKVNDVQVDNESQTFHNSSQGSAPTVSKTRNEANNNNSSMKQTSHKYVTNLERNGTRAKNNSNVSLLHVCGSQSSQMEQCYASEKIDKQCLQNFVNIPVANKFDALTCDELQPANVNDFQVSTTEDLVGNKNVKNNTVYSRRLNNVLKDPISYVTHSRMSNNGLENPVSHVTQFCCQTASTKVAVNKRHFPDSKRLVAYPNDISVEFPLRWQESENATDGMIIQQDHYRCLSQNIDNFGFVPCQNVFYMIIKILLFQLIKAM